MNVMKKMSETAFALIVVLIVIGAVATYFTISNTERKMEEQLLQDARIVANSINLMRLSQLTGTTNDIGDKDYERINKQLRAIRISHDQCKFLYVLGKKPDGTVFFFLDSQAPDADDYAPPGLIYEEVSEEYLEVFQTQEQKTVGPIHDRWGKLYTSLVPVEHPETGKLLAVLGMDMTAENWNQLILYDVVKVLGIIILAIVLVYYIQQVRFFKSQREAEKKIKESEEKFRSIYNGANDAIFIHEFESGKIIDVNDTMLKMYGYSKKEEVTGKFVDTFSSDNKKFTINQARKWRDKSVETAEAQIFEWQAKRKDGSLFWVEVSLDLVKILGKTRVIIIARDITYRKKAEHDLKAIAQRYQSLFEQAADGILTGDNNGVITEANHSICEMTGYKRAELVGSNISILFCKETLEKSPLRYDLVKAGETVLSEREMIRKDGSSLTIEMNTKKVGEGILQSYIRDVSERKKSQELLKNKNKELFYAQRKLQETNTKLRNTNEQLIFQKKELEQSKAKAETSDRLKTAFLANMSHEIRTPMNGIIGFTQILLEQEYTRKELNDYLKTIYSQSNHLMKIIDDVIDIAKIEANELAVNKGYFYLNEFFEELYKNAQMGTTSKNSKIQLVLNEAFDKKDSRIYSDPIRLKQVFDNLLDNAFKFTNEGQIEFGYDYQKEGKLLFYVKDSGIGIPPEKSKEIFQRFRQVDESLTSKYEGTGLGLSISKGIVELMGGEIWAKPLDEGGSIFYFTLPYDESWIKQKPGDVKKKNMKPAWQQKTILLVEDDYASILFMDKLLNPTKVNLITLEKGQEAIDFLKQENNIDLILMDIRLPDINGLEVTKKIREMNKEIPIIAQTAHAMGNDRKRCLEAGASEYISKPIDVDHLLYLINKYF